MRGKRTSWELEGHVMPVFIIPTPARYMVCAVPRGTAMRFELCRSNMQGEFRGCRYGGLDRTRSVCMVGVFAVLGQAQGGNPNHGSGDIQVSSRARCPRSSSI